MYFDWYLTAMCHSCYAYLTTLPEVPIFIDTLISLLICKVSVIFLNAL